MTKAATKKMDVTGTEPVESTPAEAAAEVQAHESSGRGPVWKTQINRVEGAIWKNDQKAGSRHSISITRPYYDTRESKWKRVHSFDFADLVDVKKVADEATAFIRSLAARDAEPEQEAQA